MWDRSAYALAKAGRAGSLSELRSRTHGRIDLYEFLTKDAFQIEKCKTKRLRGG